MRLFTRTAHPATSSAAGPAAADHAMSIGSTFASVAAHRTPIFTQNPFLESRLPNLLRPFC